ncbi:GreA/GreB family elongation factor [Kitasatospora sp. NPDC090091]|uniref:GreA/GreB family elongation factor n=1 Tax=Kitasatospora sp. NPDC090091 TaxID=3364081 RepID=UPI0037F7702E
MAAEPGPISLQARRALEEELVELRTERAKVAATLKVTDAVGDRADQADGLQRADLLVRLDDRITEITDRFRVADAAGPPRTDAVGMGSTATLRFADGTLETVQIGEVADRLDETLVTADSPLGRALLGHRAGETVGYDSPEGRATAEIVSIGGSA